MYNFQEKTEDFYHTVSIGKILKTCTCILLSDENRKFRGIIELSSDERIQSGKSFQEQVQLAEKFIHIAYKSDVRRMEALANDICDIIIEDLMKEYQEIFADLAALMIFFDCSAVESYTGEKMTFFHDPDGLPLELHE